MAAPLRERRRRYADYAAAPLITNARYASLTEFCGSRRLRWFRPATPLFDVRCRSSVIQQLLRPIFDECVRALLIADFTPAMLPCSC